MKSLIKNIKYFFQFITILLLFLLFKLLGLKISRSIASKIFIFFGPIFRSNAITTSNINKAFPDTNIDFKKKIIHEMWSTYGKILSEYNFIKDFKENFSIEDGKTQELITYSQVSYYGYASREFLSGTTTSGPWPLQNEHGFYVEQGDKKSNFDKVSFLSFCESACLTCEAFSRSPLIQLSLFFDG